ncbi:MAG TPA: AmmeMemoRadiSam system protein B [Chloroflexota bacterium]|nr:AmmeMemoRadiSam system protein B [Chloroflexota bacterium]
MTAQERVFPLADHPRLRPVEVFPIEDSEQRGVLLRDPADPEVRPIVLSDGAADVLLLLDGQRTVEGLSAALQLRGASLSAAHIRAFLERLDEAGYLEGARAETRLRERRSHFLSHPTRNAVHAGGAYAENAADLLQMLAEGYLHPDGPGALPGARTSQPPPRGVVAPHVDLHRGAPTYSWAYKVIAEAQPADLYVVLGTCHTPVQGGFAATRKAYDTPLGEVPADDAFLDSLQRLWGHDLFEGEFSHANEHSIEFQAVYLRSLGIAAPMVAVLCDSLHSLAPIGRSPRDTRLVAEFLGALRAALLEDSRRVTVVAAVDFAHVGQRFGDAWLVDRARLAGVEIDDREMVELLLQPDADAYYQQVMRDRDARRICGFTPLYLLSALMDSRGDLLRYTQWVDSDASSSVTFASAVYR